MAKRLHVKKSGDSPCHPCCHDTDGVWPAASTGVGLHERPREPTPEHTCFPHPIRPFGPPSPATGEGGRADSSRACPARSRIRLPPRSDPPLRRPRAAPARPGHRERRDGAEAIIAQRWRGSALAGAATGRRGGAQRGGRQSRNARSGRPSPAVAKRLWRVRARPSAEASPGAHSRLSPAGGCFPRSPRRRPSDARGRTPLARRVMLEE